MFIWFGDKVLSGKQLQTICNVWQLTSSSPPTIYFNSTWWGLITCTQTADNKNSESVACLCNWRCLSERLSSYRSHSWVQADSNWFTHVKNTEFSCCQSARTEAFHLNVFTRDFFCVVEGPQAPDLSGYEFLHKLSLMLLFCFLHLNRRPPPDHIKVWHTHRLCHVMCVHAGRALRQISDQMCQIELFPRRSGQNEEQLGSWLRCYELLSESRC